MVVEASGVVVATEVVLGVRMARIVDPREPVRYKGDGRVGPLDETTLLWLFRWSARRGAEEER